MSNEQAPAEIIWTPALLEMVRKMDFEARGNSDLAWLLEAQSLCRVADLIPDHYQFAGDLMPPERAVEAMLRGLAFECLLKARWLQVNPANRYVSDGKFVEPKQHSLVRLAKKCGFDNATSEVALLDRLTDFIVFAGRYPVALTPEANMREEDGRPLSPDTSAPKISRPAKQSG